MSEELRQSLRLEARLPRPGLLWTPFPVSLPNATNYDQVDMETNDEEIDNHDDGDDHYGTS